METTGHSRSLFLASGCLSETGLRLYSSGMLDENDRQQVNLHLAQCLFCAEAVKGTEHFLEGNTDSDLLEVQNSLKEDVRNLVSQNGNAKKDKGFIIGSRLTAWLSVAAILLLFCGIYYSVSHYLNRQAETEYAVLSPTPQTKVSEESTDSQTLTNSEVAAPSEHPEINSIQKEVAGNTRKPEPINDIASRKSDIQNNTTQGGIVSKENTIHNRVVSVHTDSITSETKEEAKLSERKETQVEPSAGKVVLIGEKVSYYKKAEKPVDADMSAVYTVVEEMPFFPGGEVSRMIFMQNNIVYPQSAKEDGISGTVYVSFLVEKSGKITNVKIQRGIGGGCDEEAVRVVKKMPDWIPGKQAGKPVSVQFVLPIKFSAK